MKPSLRKRTSLLIMLHRVNTPKNTDKHENYSKMKTSVYKQSKQVLDIVQRQS